MTTAYQKLKDRINTVSNLNKAASVLVWDTDVMMPPYGAGERSQVMATIATLTHEKATDPIIQEWINASENEIEDPWDKRNLEMIKQDYLLTSQLPESLVQKLEISRNKTNQIWQEAKAKNDWQSVEPALNELFLLTQEEVKLYADVLGVKNYDALLHLYADGNSQALIDPLFAMLQKELPPLAQEIAEKQKSKKQPIAFSMPVEDQEKAARQIVEKLGYDFNRGRLDASIHPCSFGSHQDSRMTTHYKESDPLFALISAAHETGHELYRQNLPTKWDGQPVGSGRNVALHESQSLIVERHIGLSDEFIGYIFEAIISNDGDVVSLENIRAILHQVKPSFVRVGADEVTYPLHIVLRYEIEKALFNGDITVSDIPYIWNQKMKEYLGLDVKEHRLGCMQDIHWFGGMLGYFPVYTQGALYAAQIFDAASKSIPDLSQQIASADMSAFNRFLNENIHQWGQLYKAPELIEKATGSKPDAKYFLDHLRNRYL